MVAAFAGALLIVVQSGVGGAAFGVVLTLAGVGACAAYTVICRKLLPAADSTVTVVLIQQSFALAYAVVLFAGAQPFGVRPGMMQVSGWAWLSAVGSGVFYYYAIAFLLYLSGLRRVSATVAGVFINFIPVFGIAAAYLLLAERLTVRQWIGACVVVGAVGAATLVRKDDHVAG
jgi:drug/metabolite transporter (DMT)-like permease